MKKTVLLIIVAMIMSACGTIPQATATAIPPTASFTPSPTNTPQPTATPTPTLTPKIGTVYLNPEYDLNDRVKIIEANQEALWQYTTESFMMLNSYGTDGKGTDSYMKKLAESVGIDFNDKAALLEYLKNNDIPTDVEGVKFIGPTRYNGRVGYIGVGEVNEASTISLRNFSIQIVTIKEYNEWISRYPNIISHTTCVTGKVNSQDNIIFAGLAPIDIVDHIEFIYVIANKQPDSKTSFFGIPGQGELITEAQSGRLNAYLGGVVYAMRLFVEDDKSVLHVFQRDATWGLITFPDDSGAVWIAGTDFYFMDINQHKSQIPDFPPDFIEPQ